MAINKRRDFKKLSVCIQEFLSKLPCNESTGFLRDTLYLSLLELHKYYVKEKDRLSSSLPIFTGQETLTDGLKGAAQLFNGVDKYESRWYGYNESSNETKSQGFIAAHRGDVENLKKLVFSDDVDPFGQTYLMYAVHNESSHQIECIQYMLSLNFDINSQANNGTTALHMACQYAKKEAIVELLKHNAKPTVQDKKGRSPLHWAAISSSPETIKLLLQYGADINVKDCDAMTPLMWACHFNKPKIMHILKNAYERLDPTTDSIFHDQDNNGKTILHWAVPTAKKDGLDCLKDIIRSNVSHIKDNQGRTVLHTAAKEGSVPACELILTTSNKEILHIKDKESQTALHLATLCGHGETVDYLLQSGANISYENKCGRTALQEAEFGHYHYCLLVFAAAFEQMKSGEKNKAVEKAHQEVQDVKEKDKETKRYESWVIPTGFLHDSQEIPDTNVNDDPETKVVNVAASHQDTDKEDEVIVSPQKQLFDVSEIKGFEVNPGSVNNTKLNNQTKNDKASVPPRLKSNQTAILQRSKRVEEQKKDGMILLEKDQDDCNETINQDQDELLEYSSQYLQQHGSALSAASSDSSEPENESISENIEVSSLGNDTDESEQDGNDSEKEIQEIKINLENQGESQADIKNERAPVHFPDAKQRKGNLAPLSNPLIHPSFPSKLDPLPLQISNNKGLQSKSSENGPSSSRKIVAPLQPPSSVGTHHKNPLQPAVFQEIRPPSNSYGSFYGQRGPGHGPLAHAHGKALLNNLFQDSTTTPEQKTLEMQKQIGNKVSGRLPYPPKN